ncbi:hypothetical protein FRB95_010832 [Tulasnella sp. JGI-2019a]|nr:hypothetical protein FRB95_010832 [Tulasnella sp. JGI-2019a]
MIRIIVTLKAPLEHTQEEKAVVDTLIVEWEEAIKTLRNQVAELKVAMGKAEESNEMMLAAKADLEKQVKPANAKVMEVESSAKATQSALDTAKAHGAKVESGSIPKVGGIVAT